MQDSIRHYAHLDKECHGRDLPAWLLPPEQLDQVLCDPVTQAPRDSTHLSGRGKKAPSVRSRAGKPLSGLTHTGLVFPHHPSPGERQCPTPAGSFLGGNWKNTLPALKPSLLRRPLSRPQRTCVPQSLPLALSVPCPVPAGCPRGGCLQTDPQPSPGPMGGDAGGLGGGCSCAATSPRLFQSAGLSLSLSHPQPQVWGTPSTGEEWQGEQREGDSHLASRPIAQWWVSALRSVSQPRL